MVLFPCSLFQERITFSPPPASAIQMVRQLLRASADVINWKNSNGWTPLMHLVCHASPAVVVKLLEEGASHTELVPESDPSCTQKSVLDLAAEGLKIEVFECLLRFGAKPRIATHYLLFFEKCCSSGRSLILEQFFRDNIDFMKEFMSLHGTSAMFTAVSTGCRSLYLLMSPQLGVLPHQIFAPDGSSLLHACITSSDIETANSILSYFVDDSRSLRSQDFESELKLYLNKRRQRDNFHILHFAALNSKISFVAFFLSFSKYIDLNPITNEGLTPLMLAITVLRFGSIRNVFIN
jgi:ankyrin repeat protein